MERESPQYTLPTGETETPVVFSYKVSPGAVKKAELLSEALGMEDSEVVNQAIIRGREVYAQHKAGYRLTSALEKVRTYSLDSGEEPWHVDIKTPMPDMTIMLVAPAQIHDLIKESASEQGFSRHEMLSNFIDLLYFLVEESNRKVNKKTPILSMTKDGERPEYIIVPYNKARTLESIEAWLERTK